MRIPLANRIVSSSFSFAAFLISFFLRWIIFVLPPLCQADSYLDSRSDRYLNLVGKIPLEDGLLKDSIILFFDGHLASPGPENSQEGRLFAFEPPLAGRFEIQDNAAIFYPEKVASETIYRVAVNPKLAAKDGREINPAHREFILATDVFKLKRIWEVKAPAGKVEMNVLFTFPIDKESLRKHISVKTKSDKEASFEIMEGENPRIVRLSVEEPKEWPIKISIGQGAADATGKFHTQTDTVQLYPSSSIVAIDTIRWEDVQSASQTICVYLSQNVDSSELDKNLKIIDRRSGEKLARTIAEGYGKCHIIFLSLPDPNDAEIEVAIAQGVTGERGTTLAHEYRTILKRADSPLSIEWTSWGNYEKEGAAIYIAFNQNIKQRNPVEKLKDLVQVSPEVANLRFRYETWGDNQFRIFGDWDYDRNYEVTIKPGLTYAEASTLRHPIVTNLKLDFKPVWIGFGREGQYYFPKRSGIRLPISSRFVKNAELILYRLFPSNIAVCIDDLNSGQGDKRFNESWSEKISQTAIAMPREDGGLAEASIDLDAVLPQNRRGVFCLEAKGGDYAQASKIILYTDIGVLAHWRDNELCVFAHDLFSLSPIASAKVTVYSHKNQVLGTGHTDYQGMAHLTGFNNNLGHPLVVVVEQGEDFTFLDLKPREDGTREIPSGMPSFNSEAYDAFLYADRDLYRPGETVHLRWVVRNHYGDAVTNTPLLVTIIKPNGKELLSQPTTLSELGSDGLELTTQKDYPTGKYLVQLSVPGSNQIIGSYTFHLEEFVPNRMKSSVELAQDRWLAGQEYEVKVRAEHLFGGPASERKCEAEVFFQRGGVSFEKWKEYSFDNSSKYVPESQSLGEAMTDEDGGADFKFTYAPNPKVTFPLTAIVVGRVFELGGRAVSSRKYAILSPSDTLLGVAAAVPPDGRGVEVHAAAIRLDESPAPLQKAYVTLERQAWNYYVRRYYNYNEPNWTETFEKVETREIELKDGSGSTRFETNDYGYYQIRVHSDQTPQFSTMSFYSYGGRCEIADAGRPSLIKLTLDKKEYSVGEEAVARIESPFDGQGVVVLQGEKIRKMFPVKIENKAGEIRIPLTEDDYPNIWIEATVIHAVRQGQTLAYPFSSFALANIRVANPQRKLQVDILDKPEEILPSSTAHFTIEVRGADKNPVAAELTLAAVDEGIHAISDYQSPDPYAWFARSRQPDFRRAHYYDHVVYDFDKPAPGGDMEDEMAKRASSDLETWIKPVALWSGTVRTDANGRAIVNMEIPEFNGQLRLVAVAYTDKAAGSYSQPIFVRRHHMLRVSLPRFMLPGDSSRCRAVVFNRTDEPCKAVIRWNASGALISAASETSLELAPQGEASLFAEFAAGNLSGQGSIDWEAVFYDSTGKELDRMQETNPLPVNPPAAYQSYSQTIGVKPGESVEIRNQRFIDDDRAEIQITAGANPALHLQDALSYVIGYPYGCIEQTTSRLMPLYLLRQNAALIGSSYQEKEPLLSYLQSGIDRLFAMQTASGGLSFWPGGAEPYPYGSVYAFHFLTLVKNDRELGLPKDNYESLKNYVRGVAMDGNNPSPSTYYQRAYALYALALGGDLDAIQQISRFDEINLPRAARYLLAAAIMRNTKDRERTAMYLANTPSEPYLVSEQDNTLNSDIRNTAVELIALKQMDGDPAAMAEKANKLTTFLQNNRYGNTQETAFIVTALGEYLRDVAANIEEAEARIVYTAGAETEEKVLKGSEVYVKRHQGPNGKFTITNTGKADLIVNAVSKGVPEKVEAETIIRQGVEISRLFYRNHGEDWTEPSFQWMDSYIVKLNFACEQVVKNLVIVDLLPAGFEIENPRLDPTAIPQASFKGADAPSHLEIRDDRLVLAYDSLDKGNHCFYYIVRAVTPGSYRYPPIEAECMYDSSVRGASASSVIEIEKQ
ncbi:MAG: MG2 domain-containing protein [Candidatus Omnitrophota bacterium]